eukprot:jgi/Mesvir1/10203/Mv18328-RA.1
MARRISPLLKRHWTISEHTLTMVLACFVSATFTAFLIRFTTPQVATLSGERDKHGEVEELLEWQDLARGSGERWLERLRAVDTALHETNEEMFLLASERARLMGQLAAAEDTLREEDLGGGGSAADNRSLSYASLTRDEECTPARQGHTHNECH